MIRLQRMFAVAAMLSLLLPVLASHTCMAASEAELSMAKQEGVVVWYTTMPKKGRNAIKEAFEKAFPIKLEVFQAGSHDIAGRYQSELAAGRVIVDSIHITDMVFFLDMMDNGNLLEYESPEYAAYSGLPKGWVYPGYIVPLRVLPIGSLVNTKVVDYKTVKSYDDMLKPEFKGKIAGGDVATSTRAYLNYYGIRMKYGTGLYEKLAQLDPQYYESSEKAATNCLSGEWPILFEAWLYLDYNTRVQKKAPMHGIIPKEGLVVVPAPNTIMKQAPHPNAAKVFQDFLYSRQTQIMLGEELGVHSGRDDVPGPPEMPSLKEIPIIEVDFRDAQEKRDELIAEWRKMMNR
jgi:iron(III) transport system substrate-binding protein